MPGGQRNRAAPAVLIQGRLSVDADKLRRKLEGKLELSASKLIERALLALERELQRAGQPAE